MSDKFVRRMPELKEESPEIKKIHVSRLDGSGQIEVETFEPARLKRAGEGDYSTVKSKFGSLAVTDLDRPKRTQRDARFSLNPLLRDPLSVEAEERRAIEDRINVAIQEISVSARAEAQRKGYEDGYAQGKLEARQIFEKEGSVRMDRIDHLLKELEGAKQEIFKANEAFLIELVFQIAKKVVLKDIQIDRQYLTRIASTLIEKLDLSDHLSILIHPDDRDTVAQMRESLAVQLKEVKNVHIEVSNKVPRGGCQVESDWGLIVTSIDEQLSAIEKSLQVGDANS